MCFGCRFGKTTMAESSENLVSSVCVQPAVYREKRHCSQPRGERGATEMSRGSFGQRFKTPYINRISLTF